MYMEPVESDGVGSPSKVSMVTNTFVSWPLIRATASLLGEPSIPVMFLGVVSSVMVKLR